MTSFEKNYRDIMDSFALSEKTKERIASVACARIGEKELKHAASHVKSSKSVNGSAGLRSTAARMLSRRKLLAFGAAAAFSIFAVGATSTGALGRVANALLGASRFGDGPDSSWFALKAYADAGQKTDDSINDLPREANVELGFFMPKAWIANEATRRQTTYFQFDFTLVGDDVSSATFCFAHEGALSLHGSVVCGTDVGFAETVTRRNVSKDGNRDASVADTGETRTTGANDIPALVVSEPRHVSSLTVAGNEAIGLFGTRSDGGITRTLFVQTTMSPDFLYALKRREELSSECKAPLPPESGATEEAVEAYLQSTREYQAREAQRKTEYAQLDAVMLHEIGKALSTRPLAITVVFRSGETASKRYRIAPLPKDVIAERLKPDENGNSGPGWSEWLGREPQAKPLFTVTELESYT